MQQFSGIQAHTIRIWEKRYKALTPMRSEGNTRYYNDDQLRRLLNIVSLSHTGLKISKICELTDKEIQKLIEKEIHKTRSNDEQVEYFISQVIHHAITYNEPGIDKLLSECVVTFGLQATYTRIVYPMLVRVGLMWSRDDICPAQEHFLSSIIRQKLFTAINSIPVVLSPNNPTWLLFLPEDESHDIGLLFAHYILRMRNQRIIYLGPNVPFESITDVIQHTRVDHILFFFVRLRPVNEAEEYLQKMRDNFKDASINFTGNCSLIDEMKFHSSVNRFLTVEEFEDAIQKINRENGQGSK